MDRRYINYKRNKFAKWKDRVKKHLPFFVRAFYASDKFIDYTYHKKLGQVIKDINDPYYGFDHSCTNDSQLKELSYKVALEMNVNILFSFISKL